MATNDMHIFFPLTKVDEKSHTIFGRATQEVPDSAGEIMDYKSSVPRFKAWSEQAEKRSNGKSKGNIRAMHQPIAAGKLMEMQFNNVEKAIDIGVKVIDENEWNKVLEGVYTGFSVGGKYAKRWMDNSNPTYTRYTAEPQEISLVDAPAVPTAVYAMVKADGTTEMRNFKNVAKLDVEDAASPEDEAELVGMLDITDDDEAPLTQPFIEVYSAQSGNAVQAVASVGGVEQPKRIADMKGFGPATSPKTGDRGKLGKQEMIDQLLEATKTIDGSIEKLAQIQKATADEKAKIEAELKQRGSNVGIARHDGEPLTPPKGYPEDWHQYGDPANWSWPVDSSRAQSALAYYNGGRGRDKYSAREWHTLGRRIARLASGVFGKPYQYSPSDSKVESKEEKMTNMQKGDVMSLLTQVKAALSAAVDQVGKDPKAAEDLLMGVLGNLDSATATDSASTTESSPRPPMNEQQDASVSTIKNAAVGSPTSTSSGTEPPSTNTGTPKPSLPTNADTHTGTKETYTAPTTAGPMVAAVRPPEPNASAPSAPTKATTPTATTPSSPSSPSSPSDTKPTKNAAEQPADDPLAALKAQVDAQGETLNRIAEALKLNQPATEAVQKADVVGDLQSIINAAPQEEDEFVKALTSGHVARAEELAKDAGSTLLAEMNKRALESLSHKPYFSMGGNRIYQETEAPKQ